MKKSTNRNEQNLKITGLGVISGAGRNCKETKEILFGPRFSEPRKATNQPTVEVDIHTEIFTADSTRKSMRVNLLALAAIDEALEMAKISATEIKKYRVGVCIGSTVGCYGFEYAFTTEYNLKKYPAPERLLSHFKNNTAQFIVNHFNLRGPVQLVSNACTSGADAIGIGASWLKADLCDLVICGGSEAILPQIYAGFKSMQLYAPEMCKPFDRSRRGLTLGEGAGFIILEKPDSPRKSQAQFLGFMSASDAYHTTAPHPEARGLARATEHLLVKISRSKIDFINAHGTATMHNDLVEGQFIKKLFPEVPVVATKGYTGHTLAAAGAVEAIFSILSLQTQTLPPSAGFSEPDPEINLTPTQKIISGKYQTALSFSLGFGGTNSVLALGTAP
ncbi:MAG: beta-ketoacyl-[acyl-carrier-protein] synthase family protein [Bdellovibrionaceae bacterium]|nr:beta-ketoacyl-[acyl-carrier-protein] synthase family protein [Bdellovibrio sp.]